MNVSVPAWNLACIIDVNNLWFSINSALSLLLAYYKLSGP